LWYNIRKLTSVNTQIIVNIDKQDTKRPKGALKMETMDNTTQNAASNEPEKTTTWGIRLRESEKIKLNELLETIGGNDKKEALLDVLSKAAVEHQSQQATTGIIAEMETYTKAIMQAALRQATAAAAVETATKAKYEELLDIEQDAKLKLSEQVEALKAQITELEKTIKDKDNLLSKAADAVNKKQDHIDDLENKLHDAQNNAAALLQIQNDAIQRAKAAETAKEAAEKAAADALAAQQAAEKATVDANAKVANIASKYNALNGKLEEVQKQLTKAEARAEKVEERLDKANTEKTELADKLAAIAMQSQHASSRKAAVKSIKHADADADFEGTLESKGQQKLVEE
jgi:DNA repair exonuclease SbcCD ATPase subunit